jgi:dihydrodipicolinate synthase/N-acetylneuraminate lyase
VRNAAECTGAGRIQTRIRTLGTPYAHYVEVAEAVPALNIMLYNIPIFTGVNLDPATVGRLSRLHNIVAIKEEVEARLPEQRLTCYRLNHRHPTNR